jgi:hypothetical protein
MKELVTVYTRIPVELKARVNAYVARSPERQVTHGLAELIRKGLDFDDKWQQDQQVRSERERVRTLIKTIDEWATMLEQQTQRDPAAEITAAFTVLAQQLHMLRRTAGEPVEII